MKRLRPVNQKQHDAALKLYLKYGGRHHQKIVREMREQGFTFYQQLLYDTITATGVSPGWPSRFGWNDMLTPEQQAVVAKSKRRSHYFEHWLTLNFPEWKWSWKFQREIYKKLFKLKDGGGRLMIFMPPRHGKSETVTVRYAAFRLLQDPKLNVIIGSYNQRLANKFSRKIKRTLETLRPTKKARISGDPQLTPASRLKASSEWEMAEGGVIRAVGVGAGIAGFGAGLIVIDDPVRNRSDAESLTYRDRVWEWFNDDLYTRMEPNASIILIQTRWHEDDLAGRLLREMEDGGEQWDVLSLPAIATAAVTDNGGSEVIDSGQLIIDNGGKAAIDNGQLIINNVGKAAIDNGQLIINNGGEAAIDNGQLILDNGGVGGGGRLDGGKGSGDEFSSDHQLSIVSCPLKSDRQLSIVSSPLKSDRQLSIVSFPLKSDRQLSIVSSPLKSDRQLSSVNYPLKSDRQLGCDLLGRQPGEALCPERYDVAALERIRRKLGSYSFSALYQQRPTPAEGGTFKREWFRNIVDKEPAGLRWKRGYDLAVSTKQTADYTASFRCAKDKMGNLYIADGFRARIEYPEQRRYIIERMKGERRTEHGIESALHGAAFVQDLRREVRLGAIALRKVTVDTDKLTRALAWMNLAEEGKVILVRGPWIADFIDEVAAFPTGKHDDQIDAVSLAVAMIAQPQRSFYVFD